MKIEKRSEKMENFIEGTKEAALLVAFIAVMSVWCLILFAGGPQ